MKFANVAISFLRNMKFRSVEIVKILLCIFVVSNVLFFYKLNEEFGKSLSSVHNFFHIRTRLAESRSEEVKIILFWTSFFDNPFDMTELKHCPELKCQLTNNVSLMNESDAVIFHHIDFSSRPENIPEHRLQHQRYVFYLLESPCNVYFSDKIQPGFFNWTMTYRLDSDILSPYGYFYKQNVGDNVKPRYFLNRSEILGKNKKLVVWFASNCDTSSKREDYVQILSKYIPIDIYGQCGNLSCSVDIRQQCETLIDQNYKFYLAFENSICKDYITEKYFSRAYYNSIPIVLKRSIVEHILPRHSFIAADDFKHPKYLADYLYLLSKSDSLYLEYFQWRTEGYTLKHLYPGHYENFCQLCEKLWDDSEPVKIYHDIESWWSENACDHSFVANLLNKIIL